MKPRQSQIAPEGSAGDYLKVNATGDGWDYDVPAGGGGGGLDPQALGPTVYMADYDTGAADSTADVQAAINAAYALALTYGKARLQFEAKTYVIGGALVTDTDGHNAQLTLPKCTSATGTVSLELCGAPASIQRFHWNSSDPSGTVFKSTLTAATFSTSTGLPSVIGGPSSYRGTSGMTTASFSYCAIAMRDITVRQGPNPVLTGIDLGFVNSVDLARVQVDTTAVGLAQTVPTHPTAVGIQWPITNCRGPNVANEVFVTGYYAGYGGGELLHAGSVEAMLCIIAWAAAPTIHSNYIGSFRDYNNKYSIAGLNPASGVIQTPATESWIGTNTSFCGVMFGYWSIQDNNGQVTGFDRTSHIHDGGGTIMGGGTFVLVKAGVGVVSPATLTYTGGSSNRTRFYDATTQQQTATAPSMPSSGTPLTSPYAQPADVYISGGTVTSISIGSTVLGITSGLVRLVPNRTITIVYSAAPTWKWFIE